MKKINNKIVYRVQNKKNNKCYIGVTEKSLEERKKDHLKKSQKGKSYAFQHAIATHGVDAFKWEQIDTATTSNELAKKEKEYILKYNSKEEGYNQSQGGEIKKTVYQYDIKTGLLLNKYPNLTIAGAVINLTKQNLSSVCLNVNKSAGGFYWSYDRYDKFPLPKDKRRKKVAQYTIKENFVNEFKSVAEASKLTGCNRSSIAKVCRGERKSCGGFKWKYAKS